MAANQIVTDDGVFASPPLAPDPSTQIVANAFAGFATVFGTQANAVAATAFPTVSPYFMNATDYHVCLNPGPSGFGVTLPQHPTIGITYTVDNCSGNSYTITISPYSSGDYIDGSHTYPFTTPYGSWSGYWTGTIWKTSGSR